MSRAQPMDAATRGEHYASHPDQFTGPQRRRIAHKENRAERRELEREHWASACYDAASSVPAPALPGVTMAGSDA